MRVIACMIKLDKLCKEIAEWEGWDAEEYKAKITCNYPKYKAETNRAFVCFGNSRKRVQQDLGNWWYTFLYYYVYLQRPEFVEQLSRLKGSLQVNRGPITEATSISTRATGRFLASTSTASLSSSVSGLSFFSPSILLRLLGDSMSPGDLKNKNKKSYRTHQR